MAGSRVIGSQHVGADRNPVATASMITIADRVDMCREHGKKIEEAALTLDQSTARSEKERREERLEELRALGCETLCFWLRQELTYALLVLQSSRAKKLSVDLAQHRMRMQTYAARRVDEILGAI